MTPRSPFPSESWSEEPSSADGHRVVSANGSNNVGHPGGEDPERNGIQGQSGTPSDGDQGTGNDDDRNGLGNARETQDRDPQASGVHDGDGYGHDTQGNGAVPVGDGFAVSERFVVERETPKPDEHERIVDLEERVEHLSSICEAMWDVMSEELDLELSSLTAKLAEIDATELIPPDAAEEQSICPNCGKPKPVDARLCLFCSARHTMEDYGH